MRKLANAPGYGIGHLAKTGSCYIWCQDMYILSAVSVRLSDVMSWAVLWGGHGYLRMSRSERFPVASPNFSLAC